MRSSTQDVCSPLFTEKQTSQYLTRSVSSLRRDRKLGNGPAFIKIGRSVRYLRSELDRFISAQVRVVDGAEVDRD